LNEDALLWFHQALLRSKEAAEARAYVESRGISSNTVISFGLGYALHQWNALSGYLLSQGYTERELVMAGLAREREMSEQDKGHGGHGGIYDYFRNRLIFPIRDIRSRVIGFGGRELGESKPKYLNSPQTLLFEKNSVLYAIDMAGEAIKQAGQVIIVEGYVDAVIAHQYGTKQTVACIGSAITEKHIQQLKKMTKQVTLALDPDAAGNAATEHGIEEALRTFDRTVVPVPLVADSSPHTTRSKSYPSSRQREPRGMIRLEEQVDAHINVLQLPLGEDPDELIRRDFASWLYAVSHPLPLVEYFFVVKTADLNLREPLDKTEAAKRLLPVIGMISDRIKRDAYLRKLATMISIDERTLHEELQRVLRGQNTASITARFSGQQERGSKSTEVAGRDHVASPELQRQGLDRSKQNTLRWEDYLIGLLLQSPALHFQVCGIINAGDFIGTDTRELYRMLNSVSQRDTSPSRESFAHLVPPALLETVARAQTCVQLGPPKDEAGLIREATQCANRLKRTRLLQWNTELQYLIRGAADDGDETAERQFRQRVFENDKLLYTLYTSSHIQG